MARNRSNSEPSGAGQNNIIDPNQNVAPAVQNNIISAANYPQLGGNVIRPIIASHVVRNDKVRIKNANSTGTGTEIKRSVAEQMVRANPNRYIITEI
jgi:hypothetical protein